VESTDEDSHQNSVQISECLIATKDKKQILMMTILQSSSLI